MRDKKIYFNVNQISVIEIYPQCVDDWYEWVDEYSYETRKFFGLIRKKFTRPAGWISKNSTNPTEKELDSIMKYGKRLTSDYFEEKLYYKIGEDKKTIYDRCQVIVTLNNKGTISERFDSDEEGLDWAQSILAMSDGTFDLLIKK